VNETLYPVSIPSSSRLWTVTFASLRIDPPSRELASALWRALRHTVGTRSIVSRFFRTSWSIFIVHVPLSTPAETTVFSSVSCLGRTTAPTGSLMRAVVIASRKDSDGTETATAVCPVVCWT
jgi:hypothetical protein